MIMIDRTETITQKDIGMTGSPVRQTIIELAFSLLFFPSPHLV